jgi:hypothetical protein
MPISAKRGVCRVGPAKRLLPRPPEPPFATTTRAIRDEPLVRVEDLRPDRHGELRSVAVGPVREPAAARAALAGADPLVGTDPGEVAPPRVGDEHDVAALAAVTAVRPALRHELLAPEVDRAVTAATGDHRQLRSIVEHARTLARIKAAPDTRGRGTQRQRLTRESDRASPRAKRSGRVGLCRRGRR